MTHEHKSSTPSATGDAPQEPQQQPQAAGGQPGGAGTPAQRAWQAVRQHRLVAGIAAVAVAAVIAGVASGSLNGTTSSASAGGSSGGSSGSAASAAGSVAGDALQTYAKPAPAAAFSLPALGDAGQKISLSQYQGKPLIVNFWASWCGPCQQETPLLARFYKSNAGKVPMLGIDVADSSASATAFIKAKGVSYPIAVDAALAASDAYDVIAMPQTFFLDAQHRVVQRVWGAVTQAELEQGVRLMQTR